MKQKRFPSHLRRVWANWREYKSDKRKKLRAMIKALEEFQMGCAWIPSKSMDRFDLIRREMNKLKQELSCKEWGR